MGDTAAALCPLCRAPLVAAPWPARREPYTSRQATAIASWRVNVSVRGVCDLVRASLPPPSSAAAACAALRYMRGAGDASDAGCVEGLFARIAKADWATADSHGRNLAWWVLQLVIYIGATSQFRDFLFVKDKDVRTPLSVAFTASNNLTRHVWQPEWFVDELVKKFPGLSTRSLEKLKEAGVVDIFLRVLSSPHADAERGQTFASLLDAAPALSKHEAFKREGGSHKALPWGVPDEQGDRCRIQDRLSAPFSEFHQGLHQLLSSPAPATPLTASRTHRPDRLESPEPRFSLTFRTSLTPSAPHAGALAHSVASSDHATRRGHGAARLARPGAQLRRRCGDRRRIAGIAAARRLRRRGSGSGSWPRRPPGFGSSSWTGVD